MKLALLNWEIAAMYCAVSLRLFQCVNKFSQHNELNFPFYELLN